MRAFTVAVHTTATHTESVWDRIPIRLRSAIDAVSRFYDPYPPDRGSAARRGTSSIAADRVERREYGRTLAMWSVGSRELHPLGLPAGRTLLEPPVSVDHHDGAR